MCFALNLNQRYKENWKNEIEKIRMESSAEKSFQSTAQRLTFTKKATKKWLISLQESRACKYLH